MANNQMTGLQYRMVGLVSGQYHAAMTPSESNSTSSASGLPEFGRPEHPGDLTPFLKHLLAGRTLSEDQARAAFEGIMTGTAHHAEMGALQRMLRGHVDRVGAVAVNPR